MSEERSLNSDLVECGVDEYATTPAKEEAPAEETTPEEPVAPVDEEAIKARFEELTGKKPRANSKIETLIATIAELE